MTSPGWRKALIAWREGRGSAPISRPENPTFWTGVTGRELPDDVQIVSTQLLRYREYNYNHPPGRHNIGADNLDVPGTLVELLRLLERSREGAGEPTDESALWEEHHGPVPIVQGAAANAKLTTPEDLAMAQAWLNVSAEEPS